jgi:hypothetical protein
VSQQTPEKLQRRAKRKAKSASWFRRIVESRLDRWFDAGKLTIPGVEGNVPDFARAVHDALRVELAPWVLGTKDIPSLRHANEHLMHARGRLSMAKVLLAMSLFADYRTMNLAVPYQDEHTGLWYWAGRSIQKIADAAGVSYWACKRRVDWIVKKGLMSRFEQAGTDFKGEKYGRPSIRNLLEATLWKSIGQRTAAAVKAAGRAAYQKWKDAQDKIQPVVDAVKLAAQKAAAANTRTKELANPRSRSPQIGQAIQDLLMGVRPSYLRKPAPS